MVIERAADLEADRSNPVEWGIEVIVAKDFILKGWDYQILRTANQLGNAKTEIFIGTVQLVAKAT